MANVTVTFGYTGGPQSWVAPAGCTSATFECWGGQGKQDTSGVGGAAPGGKGGYAKGTRTVTPGTTYYPYVGGRGASFNGGGVGDGDGGGGTDVRTSTSLASRFIVAGGGGGVHYAWDGGGGGGLSGGASDGGDAAGGTQTGGYALGQGGPSSSGGCGGGGYWGGFGSSRGGGGGSGFVGTLTGASMQTGVRSGDGQVVITYPDQVPPYAPVLTEPANNGFVFPTEATVLEWSFQDPNPGDHQTRADVRWKQNPGDAWTTVANAATTGGTYTVAAGTWVTGKLVEWQVATWDATPLGALAGPWSGSRFVNTITTVPAPTVASPIVGATLTTATIDVEWALPSGYSQDAYQVTRSANSDGTGAMYYDSGQVGSASTVATVPLDAVSGRNDYIRVRFLFRGHWSPWVSVAVILDWGPPMTPLLVLTQVVDAVTGLLRPEVRVSVTSPLPPTEGHASTAYCTVTRTGPDGVPHLVGSTDPSGSVVDLLPGAGPNDYRAVAYAASGSSAQSY